MKLAQFAYSTPEDTAYLQRCIHLARLGGISTLPNPMVGCVVVYEGNIIGEGFHPYAGGPHAEVQAIASVQHKSLLADSTVYVSLEPCNFYGKTPACTELLLKHKVPRLVVGCLDPNPRVSGKGLERLQEHGVHIRLATNSKPFEELIRVFTTIQLQKRPYISLKWAETADGFIAGLDEKGLSYPIPITSHQANTVVHRLRSHHQAIVIGRRTALIDNPSLTTRLYYGDNPLRIVFDKNLSLPTHLKLFTDGNPTIVLNQHKNSQEGLIRFFQPQQWADLHALVGELYEKLGICSMLIEGGSHLHQQFIDQQLYDAIYRFQSPLLIHKGLQAPNLKKNQISSQVSFIGQDLLFYYPVSE